ncbi:hypothetical protein B0H16DRAFT_1887211 [Mycena metata]|uniref:TEA domain-containing protein n=1 Tax=Mycena metata TaxID=1033252 RepID=A0AAD7J0U0_9AGAR|nr:hypothetical protein B0H16DRAFT_1887211 [Mycena metata]
MFSAPLLDDLMYAPGPIQPPTTLDDGTWILTSTYGQNLGSSVLDTGRMHQKSHRGEVVWPSHLVTALIEGLQHYRPPVCRQTVLLRQYPGRNRFISRYILSKTGEYRTMKQVGSRVQQLRELSPSPELHKLLFPTPSPGVESQWTTHDTPGNETSHPTVFITIMSEAEGLGGPHQIPEQTLDADESAVQVSREPRRLVDIDPSVVLVSESTIMAQSRFDVCTDDGVVHTEVAEHETLEDIYAPRPGHFYRVKLIPLFWEVIVNSPDPTRYIIIHEVTRFDGAVVFSATYAFRYGSKDSTAWNTHIIYE